MVEDMDYHEDYMEVILDHKVKDFETLLVMDIVDEFRPIKYFTQTRNGWTYLTEKNKYEFIVRHYALEPDFPEFLYQMHLQTFARYVNNELKWGILSV